MFVITYELLELLCDPEAGEGGEEEAQQDAGLVQTHLRSNQYKHLKKKHKTRVLIEVI